MKRFFAVIVLLSCILSGCSDVNTGIDRALALRQKLQENNCAFSVEITADYGDYLYSFGMDCEANTQGDMTFTVTEPESIKGITGIISDEGGNLTFDDQVLAFELLADDQITPVSAPWLLLRTLRGGYIRAGTTSEDSAKLIIDDSYEDDSLQLDIWLNKDDQPTDAEILWQGRRVVSLKVRNFLCE